MTLNLNPAQFATNLINPDGQVIELPDGTNEEVIDLHTASCLVVYAAANDPTNITANQNVKHLVLHEDSSIDVDKYMKEIRDGNRAATLRLIALVTGGLNKLADEVLGDKE
jgi:hypothetical protein